MLFLAIRHLISRPHQTILTFMGILLGTAGYVVFAGIQLGQQEYITDRLINTDSHIRISPRDEYVTPETFKDIFFNNATIKWIIPPSGLLSNNYVTNVYGWFQKLDRDPSVTAYSAQLNRDVIYKNGSYTIPGRIIGIDTEKQPKVTNITKDITHGTLNSIGQGNSLIMIGDDLMKKLGARPNATVSVVTSSGEISPVKIVAVFKSGMRQLDERTSYASIMTVQQITKSSGQVSDIVIRLKDVNDASRIASDWSKTSPDKVESWDQANSNFLEMIKMQVVVRQITTTTIMLIVAFGIYNILNMVVNQKKREIAILRSMGYNEKDTILLFMIQGLILGITGAVAGMITGWAACKYLETIKIGLGPGRGGMGKGHILISWNINIYIIAFMLACLASTLASFIPARTAGRLSPIDIIRGSG